MARAVMRLFDGVQLAFGPTIDNGFYYDFELDRTAHRRRLSRASKPRWRRSSRRTSRSSASRCRATKPSICPRLEADIQSRAHRNGLAEEDVALVLSPGRVRRPLPRSAHSQHRAHRQRVQVALRRRRLLERRLRSRAIATPLRHRVLRQGRARRASRASRRSQAPRSPRARQAAGVCSPSARSSARADPVAAQGSDHPPARSKITSTTNFASAVTTPSTLRTSAASNSIKSRGTSRITATASSRRSKWTMASGTCSSR